MTGLDEFLMLFGDVTLSEVVVFLFAAFFLFLIYKEIKKYIDVKFKEQQAKAEEEKANKEKLEKAWNVTQKYPQYHQESIDIRNGLQKEIKEMRADFQIIMDRLDRMEEQNKKRECSKLRDMLLQHYRYYTNEQQNPSQSWTKMESDTFWELFDEYEEAGGNGYMHSVVQKEMNKLIVINNL